METIGKAASAASDLSGLEDTKVELVIEGGAPSERYEYRLSLTGEGEAETSFLDEIGGIRNEAVKANVKREGTAKVFRQILDTRILELPPIQRKLEPDSLVMTLAIRSGDVSKLVQVPAFEPRSEPAVRLGRSAFVLPVKKDIVIDPSEAPQNLILLVDALAQVQKGSFS